MFEMFDLLLFSLPYKLLQILPLYFIFIVPLLYYNVGSLNNIYTSLCCNLNFYGFGIWEKIKVHKYKYFEDLSFLPMSLSSLVLLQVPCICRWLTTF